MKRSLLAVAVALASGQALAIDSTTVTDRANQMFISGATSTNTALYSLTVLQSTDGPCQPGSTDVYVDSPTATNFNSNTIHQFLAACNGVAGASFASQKILIAKESNGGSNNGTRNVALAPSDASQQLAFINPAAPSCADSITVPATSVLESYTLHRGCTGTANQVPDGGFADVDPALFLTTTKQIENALSSLPGFQVVFAPVVTKGLYRALQAAENLPQDDLPSHVPSLTRAQLHAIFSGQYFTWDEVGVDFNGNPFLPGKDVYVCRRGNDSGTQASFASFFLNERCNNSVPTFIKPDVVSTEANGVNWDSTTYGNKFTFAGHGGIDVASCETYHENNGDYAIGVLATDTPETDDSVTPFRYLGVDGAPPTLSAAANGSYQFVVENVINVRKPSAPPIIQFISDHMGNPDIISQLNVATRNIGGDGGILGVPTASIAPNTPPVDQATMRTRPVSSMSRHINGTNNCQPDSAVSGSEVVGGGMTLNSLFD